MAKVFPGEIHYRPRTYDSYTQTIGGHENIKVRRKVGEPCDTLHPSCKALRIQRLRFSKAAKDYSKLSYYQKKWWRHQLEYH